MTFLVSVVIPVYNGGFWLGDLLQSIVNQESFEKCQVIIVDDGSTDCTKQVGQYWANLYPAQIMYIPMEHRGASRAKNLGLREARAPFITFADADDRLCPGALSVYTYLDTDPGADLVIFGMARIDGASGRVLARWTVPKYRFASPEEYATLYIRDRNLMIYSNANKIYRRKVIEEAGLCFNESLEFGEDRLFNYTYLQHCGAIYCLDEVLYEYISRGEVSATSKYVDNFFSVVKKLHSAKIACMKNLYQQGDSKHWDAFVQFDLGYEFSNVCQYAARFYPLGDSSAFHRTMIVDWLNCDIVREYFLQARGGFLCSMLRLTYKLYMGARKRNISIFPVSLWGYYLTYRYGERSRQALKSKLTCAMFKNKITRTLFFSSSESEWQRCKVVIILGSRKCYYRAQRAVEIFGHRSDVVFIGTGGNISAYYDYGGRKELEGHFIGRQLEAAGISRNRIIEETKSTCTVENLVYAFDLIQQHNLDGPVGIISGAFHMKRVQQLVEKLGTAYEVVYIPAQGRLTSSDGWSRTLEGRRIVMDEYRKVGRASGESFRTWLKRIGGKMPLAMYNWLSSLISSSDRSLWKICKNFFPAVYFNIKYGCMPWEYKRWQPYFYDKKVAPTLYVKRHNERYVLTINDQDYIHLLRKKHILLDRLAEHLPEALGREYIYVPTTDKEEFIHFIERNERWLYKPDGLAGGSGIAEGRKVGKHVILKRRGRLEAMSIDEAYTTWKYKEGLLESFIQQHEELANIHKQSVNSIRIHTRRQGDTVEVIRLSSIRFGSGDSIIDFDQGIQVGIEEGILMDYGFKSGNWDVMYMHPDSHILFAGLEIPFWTEIVELVKKVAAIVPEISYIGWDVAVTPTGPVIIEGNGASASYDILQEYMLREHGHGCLGLTGYCID